MIDEELFQDFLNSLELGMEVFLNVFPEEKVYEDGTADFKEAVVFSFKTESRKAGMEYSNLNVLIRAGHPRICKECGEKIISLLDMKTNFMLGGTQVVLIKAVDLTPNALGLDNNNNNVYQLNFKVVASKD